MIPPTRFLVIPPVISGLVVGSASWIFFYSICIPGRPALSAFAVGLLIGFAMGMSYWTNRVVGYSREQPKRQYNLDYDNPDFIETHYTGGGMEGHYVPLPITKNQLRQVANLIIQGASFSHATLAGPGKPLTRSEYEALRTRLEQRGWIAPRNHNSPNQGAGISINPQPRRKHTHTHTRGGGRVDILIAFVGALVIGFVLARVYVVLMQR